MPSYTQQTIDPVNGYNYTINLGNISRLNISLDAAQTQFLYTFQNISFMSFNLRENKFSLSTSFTILNQSQFTVRVASKFKLFTNYLEIKLLIFNRDKFVEKGCRVFEFKIPFGTLTTTFLTYNFAKGDAPATANMLFGLQDFEVIGQTEFGFNFRLTLNIERLPQEFVGNLSTFYLASRI